MMPSPPASMPVCPMSCVPRRLLMFLLAIVGSMPAAAAVTSGFSSGTLTVSSDGADDIFVACSGVGGNVLVNGANPGTGPVACSAVTTLSVGGGPGANLIDLTGVNASTFPAAANRSIDGGDGGDTIRGSASVDVIFGGPGTDTIDGNQGNDIVFLGEGDDTFTWQPGDGSDTLEGQGGNDRLVFDGSGGSENVTLSPNGTRAIFFRDIGAITMDTNDIERIEYSALGGADTMTINPLAGTDVSEVELGLAGTLGGATGDANLDTVNLVGGPGADSIVADATGGTVTVTTGVATLAITGVDPTLDVLNLQGGDGNDSLLVGAGLAGQFGTLGVDGGIGNDTVTVRGTPGADVITIAALTPFVAVSGVALIDALATENLRVDALAGNDVVGASGNVAALFAMTLDGGADDDTLSGGNGADVLFGGSGNDVLDGNQQDDIVLGGEGDDLFPWDPGDGNDILEGQGGSDTLRFNGSGANENIALTANGQRLLLTRDIGAIVMDLDDVEFVDVNPLSGIDALIVNDIAATDATRVRVTLSATLGGTSGDGQADTVTVNGSGAADSIALTALSTVTRDVRVSRGALAVEVYAADPPLDGIDRLVVNALGGDDTIGLSAVEAGIVSLTLDGGGGSAMPGDIVALAGEAVAETYTIAPNAARVTLARSAPLALAVDLHAIEWLELALDAGADILNTQGLPGTSQLLDGGSPGVVPGDSLNVAGFTGDVSVSPILVAGSMPIVHSNFEQSTNQQVIEAFLSGAQETPPNPSSGRGYGTVTLNAAQDQILVFLEFSGLAGNNTLTHIHGPAPRRVAAAPIIDLPASGTSSGSFTVGPIAITPTQRDQLKAGLWYFNVHSTAPGSAGGEIRGQLDDLMFRDGFE
jgi:Ca2+-binding RTX toxin-like protein